MASYEKRDVARQDLKELMEKIVIAAAVTDGSQAIALAETLTATEGQGERTCCRYRWLRAVSHAADTDSPLRAGRTLPEDRDQSSRHFIAILD